MVEVLAVSPIFLQVKRTTVLTGTPSQLLVLEVVDFGGLDLVNMVLEDDQHKVVTRTLEVVMVL